MNATRMGTLAVIGMLASCVAAPAQQLPGVPAAPTVPGAPALPGGPVPTAAAPATAAPAAGAPAGGGGGNIWSFFMKTPQQKAQCKAHFCNSRIGMFINNMMVPFGAATGGLLGPICPPNAINPADLNKPSTSAEGAAAKIKAEEAQAKAKIAAIEYLATVDCRYYPEAEAALIAGLRAEKNECVRIAAAKAFVNGCCCSPKVMKALTISVSCSNKDGFPAEASELVRTYAYVALERCLQKCVEIEPELPPEPPPAAKKAMYEAIAPMGATLEYSAYILVASYYPVEAKETPAQLVAEARRTLSHGLKISPQTAARMSGPKNVAGALFPSGVRSSLSFSSFALPSLPSLPSFASIRRSAPHPQATPQTQQSPAWLPPPQSSAAASLPPPQITIERQGTAPISVQQAEAIRPVASPPQQVMAVSANTGRNGRGNLLNIFQDAWRR